MNKKKIFLAILIIILVIAVLYAISVAYKYTKFSAIQDSLEKFNSSDNRSFSINRNGENIKYYYKDETVKGYILEDERIVAEIYCKDGKRQIKDESNDNIQEDDIEYSGMPNLYLGESLWLQDYQTYDSKELLKLALNPFNTISTTKIGNTKYYKIKYSNDEIIYFDTETLLPVISIYKTDTGSVETNLFTVQNGTVSDEDVLKNW